MEFSKFGLPSCSWVSNHQLLSTFSFNFKRLEFFFSSSLLPNVFCQPSFFPANKIYFICLRIRVDLTYSIHVWNLACLWVGELLTSVFGAEFSPSYSEWELWILVELEFYSQVSCSYLWDFFPFHASKSYFLSLTFAGTSCRVFRTVPSTISYVILCWQLFDLWCLCRKIAQHCELQHCGLHIRYLVLAIETMIAELAGLATLFLYILNYWILPDS